MYLQDLGDLIFTGGKSIFLFLFPKYVGKPETTAQKIIVMTVFVIGVAAGLYNLYLMNPGKYGL